VSAKTVETAKLAEAFAAEQAIADEAAAIRGDAVLIDTVLFLKLWPLLRRPIPEGFIKSIGVVKGKPYESTGISSVQVQIGRMDNVLTPLGWHDVVEYELEGRLAHVTVSVLGVDGEPIVQRDAWGGVNQASTTGNLYKGTYTNAAKVAFARIGPGHEVYVGATDLDPDVHAKAANEQAKPVAGSQEQGDDAPRLLRADERKKVVKAVEDAKLEWPKLMAAVGFEDTDKLTTADAFEIRKLIDERAAAKTNGAGS